MNLNDLIAGVVVAGILFALWGVLREVDAIWEVPYTPRSSERLSIGVTLISLVGAGYLWYIDHWNWGGAIFTIFMCIFIIDGWFEYRKHRKY